MIRGAIESVSQNLVQGWIDCECQSLRGATVLAFSGSNCIGSGQVGIYRKDLEAAGLGDGFRGYEIPVAVPEGELHSVTVRLEGSDSVLLQRDAVVRGQSTSTRLTSARQASELGRIKWALQRGRLSQIDFDYLKLLLTFGVYEYGLLRRASVGDSAVADNSTVAAQQLLESCAGGPVSMQTPRQALTDADLQQSLAEIRLIENVVPMVVLATNHSHLLEMVEGSHVSGRSQDAIRKVTSYVVNESNLLVLNINVDTTLLPAPDDSGLICIHHAVTA